MLVCCCCCCYCAREKCFLIPLCTQLPTGLGLVKKRTVLSAVSADWGQISFSPKTNGTGVPLEAHWDHPFNQVSVYLFGTLIHLMYSHRHKRTTPNWGKHSQVSLTELNKAGVKALKNIWSMRGWMNGAWHSKRFTFHMSAYCPHSVRVTGQLRHSHLWHLRRDEETEKEKTEKKDRKRIYIFNKYQLFHHNNIWAWSTHRC